MKKTFLKNILEIMHVNSASGNNKNINHNEASDMQIAYIDGQEKAKNIKEYPPYVDIAGQLSSPKSEIFYGAVYYLVKIAENESKYSEQIKNILKQYLSQAKRKEEEMLFIKQQIEQIDKYQANII